MKARIALGMLVLLAAACERPERPVAPPAEVGKLVVATLNGPATWYEDAHDHPTGFEHDLVSLFARDLGLPIEYFFVDSPDEAEKALAGRRAHLAAALLPRRFDPPGGLAWGPSYRSAQHRLVWRTADPRPRKLADLTDKRVGVIAGTFADHHVAAPPNLPGTLVKLPADATPEDLLTALAGREIDAAILDGARFTVERKHFPTLDTAFDIGAPVDYAWRVGTVDQPRLLERMEAFFARIAKDGTLQRLSDRWFGHAARLSAVDAGTLLERVEKVLPDFKAHFLEAERLSGFDWRLIAAIGYQESHWNPLATSPTGVRGLMMLTEITAEHLDVADRLDARESILAGARLLGILADRLPPRIGEPDRTFLALAAYNLGYGHLDDARILAQRKGLSPDSWQDVKLALPGLADPATYQRLRHGFARGHEALQFVDAVRNYRDILERAEPREGPLPPRVPASGQGSSSAATASR